MQIQKASQVRAKSASQVKKEADTVFSRYIRLRDMDENGLCHCVTCGRVGTPKEMDCGHYQKRQHMATRYDERNCHAQCKRCNNWEQGAQDLHAIAIDTLYGDGTATMLRDIARTRGKYPLYWMTVVRDKYKDKLKKLIDQKGSAW